MKTDHLIDMLSTNLEPIKNGGRASKAFAIALVIGGAGSFCLMLATVGVRTAASGGFHPAFLLLKLLFMLVLIALGTALLARLIRPGSDGRRLYKIIFLPVLVVGFAGVVALALEPSWAAWKKMILETQWATCILCIPLFAVIPFLALIWALRKGAPTNLTRTGAIAGLVAGALGAAVYAFHCPDDSLPFIGIWYGAMVLLCAWIGRRLGPSLLRW
jgi:hypothetical protein